MDTRWLSCSVSPGQFPSEYAVAGRQHDGKCFSLFAPRETVSLPTPDGGEGLLRVQVVGCKDDLVLVRLPAQTLENGQYVTVAASQLQAAPPSPKASV
jgi:hypothetical protein